LAKREFKVDTGSELLTVEGHEHRNVAVKYLMKRRRSLLSTRDSAKVDEMFNSLPRSVKIMGRNLTKVYNVVWERVGRTEFEGARFIFKIEEAPPEEASTAQT
jgi:predicted NAD-dependent protein-ADP-ribosyltransferase YbiA (DUF1768 family)